VPVDEIITTLRIDNVTGKTIASPKHNEAGDADHSKEAQDQPAPTENSDFSHRDNPLLAVPTTSSSDLFLERKNETEDVSEGSSLSSAEQLLGLPIQKTSGDASEDPIKKCYNAHNSGTSSIPNKEVSSRSIVASGNHYPLMSIVV
jgi:hypothetical protein